MPYETSPEIDFSSVGLVTDMPANAVPTGGWSNCLDVRCRNGSVQGVNAFEDYIALHGSHNTLGISTAEHIALYGGCNADTSTNTTQALCEASGTCSVNPSTNTTQALCETAAYGASQAVTTLTSGKLYEIISVGLPSAPTDFTAIGSVDNVAGTQFVATGAGTGLGTAKEVSTWTPTNTWTVGAEPTLTSAKESVVSAQSDIDDAIVVAQDNYDAKSIEVVDEGTILLTLTSAVTTAVSAAPVGFCSDSQYGSSSACTTASETWTAYTTYGAYLSAKNAVDIFTGTKKYCVGGVGSTEAICETTTAYCSIDPTTNTTSALCTAAAVNGEWLGGGVWTNTTDYQALIDARDAARYGVCSTTANTTQGACDAAYTTVTAGSFVTSTLYVIKTLGTTTQAQWNTAAGTTDVTYAVGSTFTAAAAGAGNGTAESSVWTYGLHSSIQTALTAYFSQKTVYDTKVTDQVALKVVLDAAKIVVIDEIFTDTQTNAQSAYDVAKAAYDIAWFAGGTNTTADPLVSGGKAVAITQFTPAGASDLIVAYVVVKTNDECAVVLYDTGTSKYNDVTNQAPDMKFTYSDTNPPQIFVFNEILIVNPGNDAPPQFTAANVAAGSLVKLPNWPDDSDGSPIIARVVRPFNNRLIAMNILEEHLSGVTDDVDLPIDLLWSSHIMTLASIDQVEWIASTTNTAGDAFLTDTPGKILDGGQLGEFFIAYKSDSVVRVRETGDTFVLAFESIFEDDGIYSTRCFANIGGSQHLVVGNYGVYIHDGQSQKQDIAKDLFKDTMYLLVKAAEKDRAFVFQQTRDREVWFCLSSTSNSGDGCDLAFVYDYASGKLHKRSLPGISDVYETELNGQLEIFAAKPGDTKLQKLSSTVVVADGFFERQDDNLTDNNRIKQINRIHVNSKGSVKLALVGTTNLSDSKTYTDVTFDPATNHKIDVRTSGRFLNLRVTMNGAINPELTKLQFDLKLMGVR